MRSIKMQWIWDEVFPPDYGEFDTDILDVSFPPKRGGDFRMTFDVILYDWTGPCEVARLRRRLTARNAYVFTPGWDAGLINQSIKQIWCYPDIVRLDIATTGTFLGLECDQFDWATLS